MLSYLSIKSFGIFKEVSLEFKGGLSVFTGETGAGKSMIVDAVMSALGSRTPKEMIMTGHDNASIELLAQRPKSFDNLHEDDPIFLATEGEDEIILSRDISKDRSYLRVQGRIATMALAQEIGAHLLDVHGQQDHHSLLRPGRYISVIDSLKRGEIEPLRERFKGLYRKREELKKEISYFSKDEKERQREIDLLSFQVDEIEKSKLNPHEEDDLKEESKLLSQMSRLMEICDQVQTIVFQGGIGKDSAQDILGESSVLLEKAESIDPKAEDARKAVEEIFFSLEAAADLFRDYRASLTLDPERLNEVQTRLDHLQRLKAKYGANLEEVIEYGERAQEELEKLLRSEEIKEELSRRLGELEKEMLVLGLEISGIRAQIAQEMSEDITGTLWELGMKNARFWAQLEMVQDDEGIPDGKGNIFSVREDGFDRGDFLFTANLGVKAQSLGKVASGGELSRVMLAIKAFMAKDDPVPTLIFDEIDAGVGGKAGQMVAEKLNLISQDKQVFCVTHLPSIAAMADNHYVIEKEEEDGVTKTKVTLVDGPLRVKEIARMLSGKETGASLEHAKDMLFMAQKIKGK